MAVFDKVMIYIYVPTNFNSSTIRRIVIKCGEIFEAIL